MPRIKKLDEAAEADSFGEIYRWLKRRYRRVGSTVAKARCPWAAVAREVGAAGVLNTGGQSPTSEQVRDTWSRVKRDVAKE
jgi:hypothetical protein